MKILKFGGSSVATPQRIESVIDIVKPYLNGDTAVVFSAFGGVTDVLIQLSNQALEGNLEYKTKLAEIEKRHLEAVRALIGVQKQSSILAQVNS
jgi:bifunctional aspartokinase / homoserine dehydrogenase 1